MISRRRKITFVATLLALILLATASAGFAQSEGIAYEVAITNLTEGQPLTPPLVATHHEGFHIFTADQPASSELQDVAENGNLSPLSMLLSNSMDVYEVVTADVGDPPVLMPGDSVTFHVHADEQAQFLSFVSMLVCTNDGFAGLDSVRLPAEMGGSATFTTASYDAGTEMNTESFADLVPPCPALTGVESMAEGADMSNPDIAEDGVVMMHAGIQGTGDLDAMIHGWTDPVAEVTITYADGMMMEEDMAEEDMMEEDMSEEDTMMEPEMLPKTGGTPFPTLPAAAVVVGLLLIAGGASVARQRQTVDR